ncbi:hypothetical protein HW561_21455 [Rhodobacteraceae bacterium B1Z28]|uniref:Sulfotransferase family protein n=1 Tax=Ruegeria haliotis TaxID=2747601 RepID=A0ABX2PXT9_9RHOB|nr:hypothetical protein [Ruegeria haliotis]NVO58357.1 hypothetical protein [Ruegeria haliotis]
MSRLLLHVGHSKTGTSFLQALLRENRSVLARHGYDYPSPSWQENEEENAEVGQGNGLVAAQSPHAMKALLHDHPRPDRGLILSSEEFFPQLATASNPELLGQLAIEAGYDEVSILLAIRDPVSHAASLWMQYVKRAGGTAPLERFFELYSVPDLVLRFLEAYGDQPNVSIKLFNYSRHKANLADRLADWLGLAAQDLNAPKVPTINRGLTRAETALQLALNAEIGRRGRILSDALCSVLPEVTAHAAYPAKSVQVAMLDRLSPTFKRLNMRLETDERYQDTLHEPQTLLPHNETNSLSQHQLKVAGSVLGQEIRNLLKSKVDSASKAPHESLDGTVFTAENSIKGSTEPERGG